MSRRRRLLLLLGLLAATAGPALYYARVQHPRLAFAWADGTRYVYTVSWRSEEEQSLPLDPAGHGAAISGFLQLDADVSLAARGKAGGRTLMALRIDEIRDATTRLGGQLALDTAQSRTALLQQEALLSIDASGQVDAVHFPPDASEYFQNAVQMLVSELQVRLPDRRQASWQADETGYLGEAVASYRHEGTRGPIVRLQKEKATYRSFRSLPWRGPTSELAQDLTSSAVVEVHSAGYLQAISVDETLAVAHPRAGKLLAARITASMRFLRKEADGRPSLGTAALAAYRRRALGAVAESRAAEESALAHQAGGLTWEALEGRLLGLAVAGPTADERRFIWQATGLLELHPELCERLVALFPSPKLDGQARGLILDLLSHVGHEPAQKAMVAILDSPKAQGVERDYIRFVQRVSFVKTPAADTARFIEEKYRHSVGHVRIAAAYATGSTIAHLGSAGETDLARDLNRRLVDDLERATASEDRAMLLNALGNAGQVENVPAISGFARDPSPKVREAVSRALWKTPGGQSAQTLLALASDPERVVQASALRILGGLPDGDASFDELAQHLLAGRVSPDNYHVVLRLVGKIGPAPVRREVLDYLIAHAPADTGLRNELLSAREET